MGHLACIQTYFYLKFYNEFMNKSLHEFTMNKIKNTNVCLDFRRRGSVGSHILRNNNLAQDTLNGSGMSTGIDVIP